MPNKSCIVRLSRYRNALLRLKALDFVKVFSENLADTARGSATQVRKDFSLFGITGNKRGGYQVDELLLKLNKILGKDKRQKFIVVGVGNIGRALLNYPSFKKNEIELVAGFDVDLDKHSDDSELPIFAIEQLESYVKDNDIKFGIIAVPDFAAQQVFELMLDVGIKGILNFAPICLREPSGCVVRNLSFETEIENIIYFTNLAVKTEVPE